jgi:uncharacterized membrane protein YeiH
MHPMLRIDVLITVVEVCATLAFAVSGVIEAARKRMDIVGVFAVAFIAAFGGGTLRDLLLDKRPFFWVQHQEYVWLIFIVSLAAIPLLRLRRHQLTEWAMHVSDALGLGLFSVAGTSQALEVQMPLFSASLMGVITAVFGGVLRDIICNEIPTVFRDRRPYALCSFIGCWSYLVLHLLAVPALVSFGAGIAVAAGLRMMALARGWRVPSWPIIRKG